MSKRMFVCFILTILGAGVASAQSSKFGSWFTETGSDGLLYAATVNDSGALLGQFCFPAEGSCLWLLGMITACDKGDEYLVLANSDVGAAQLKVLCDEKLESGLYRYVFTDFDTVDDIVKKGARVGFAVPLKADQFRIVRFDLSGATTAITMMRSIAEKKTKPSQKTPSVRGTRDQLL